MSALRDSPAVAITRHELPNGLPVFHQRAPSTSVTFSVSWIGEGGSARDPPGSQGVATAASRLLQAGTRRRSKREFARELDRLASTFSARASWERLEIEGSGPQDAEEEVISLLYEALTQPKFEEAELSRVVREMREGLLREESQPDEKADRLFLERLLPPGHPYRANPLGSVSSQSKLRTSSVRRFHESHLNASGSKIILTSHDPPAECLKRLRRTFGELEEGRALPPPTIPHGKGRSGGPPYYPLPGTTQVEVVVGGTAPVRSHPAYPALALADQVLGGRPILSRLFQEVRERNGLAYGAGSELESLTWGGLWTADAGTDIRHVERVRSLLLDGVRSLATKGPKPGELDLIRESFLGSLPLLLETSPQAHGLAVEVAYFDLPLDHFRTWPMVLRELRPRQIQEAVAEHLWADGEVTTIAVGPPPPGSHPKPPG